VPPNGALRILKEHFVRKLIFFLVGAAAVVGGAVAIGPVSAAPVRSSPPKLQVGPSCDAAGRGSVVLGRLGRNKQSCLADETTAQDTLKPNWPTYLAADKTDCVTLENSGGPASYVELLSCLEVIRDARTIRNADPLDSDPAPVNTRRKRN
jgi:hypothetical protein